MEEAFSISAEWNYLQKVFLGRIHSCPGNIQCALDCTHNLPVTGRYFYSVLPALSASASPPARKPLVLPLMSREKRWFPSGTCLTGTAARLAGPLPPDPRWRWDDLVRGCGMGFSRNKLPPLLSVPFCQPQRFWVIPAYCTKAQIISRCVSL